MGEFDGDVDGEAEGDADGWHDGEKEGAVEGASDGDVVLIFSFVVTFPVGKPFGALVREFFRVGESDSCEFLLRGVADSVV